MSLVVVEYQSVRDSLASNAVCRPVWLESVPVIEPHTPPPVERHVPLTAKQPFVRLNRGRDAHYWAPPAQNRTCGIPAYGSHLGCLTASLPYAVQRLGHAYPVLSPARALLV